MQKRFMFVMCAMAAVSVGCKQKSPDGGAGSGSAAGSATVTPSNGSAAIAGSGSTAPTAATGSGSAAAPGPGCASPTAYKSAVAAFCIEAPGYTAKETKSSDYDALVTFQKGTSSFAVSISLQDTSHSTYDAMASGMDDRSKDPAKVIAKGDLADVTGKFLVENVGKHVAESLQVIVKGKTHSYACGGENFMPTVDPVILAACKSIRPAE